MTDLTGVKLVAYAPLRWSRDGDLVSIEPGDVFELDDRDVEVARIDPAFWIRCGAVGLYDELDAPDAPATAKNRGHSGRRGPARLPIAEPVADVADGPPDDVAGEGDEP